MNKIEETIKLLVLANKIPESGPFELTEQLIRAYIEIYSSGSMTNGKFNEVYARKLAGLNLMRLQDTRGQAPSSGVVYVITNPAWPGKAKVGMTVNLQKRLAQYQVYDPYKLFKVNHYEFVMNRRRTESLLLKTFQLPEDNGEWVSVDDTKKIIVAVRNSEYVK